MAEDQIADLPLLLRKSDDGIASAMMNGVAVRFERDFQKHLRAMGGAMTTVSAGPVRSVNAGEWLHSQASATVWQFVSVGLRGKYFVAAPRVLTLRLVDLFYGGSGQAAVAPDEWTGAERRFARRFGEEIGQLTAQAWDNIVALDPRLDDFSAPLPKMTGGADTSELVVQEFTLSGSLLGGLTLGIAYPAAAIALLAGSAVLPPQPQHDPAQQRWLAALHQALGQVTMPARSVLARPEMALGKILSLQVGDVIPLTMPQQVPINVAGYCIATGTVGDANGQTAIKIDQITKRVSA